MKTKTVFLVEDDFDDEFLTMEGLRLSGVALDATHWNDSPDALNRLLDPLRPLPDLVVIDYRMPKLSGLDVLVALRSTARSCRLPVVILSSALSPSQVEECRAQGATACMLKATVREAYVADVALMVRFFLDICTPFGPEDPLDFPSCPDRTKGTDRVSPHMTVTHPLPEAHLVHIPGFDREGS